MVPARGVDYLCNLCRQTSRRTAEVGQQLGPFFGVRPDGMSTAEDGSRTGSCLPIDGLRLSEWQGGYHPRYRGSTSQCHCLDLGTEKA